MTEADNDLVIPRRLARVLEGVDADTECWCLEFLQEVHRHYVAMRDRVEELESEVTELRNGGKATS